MFIEILFKILLFKGGVLIYAEHCIYIYIYIYIFIIFIRGVTIQVFVLHRLVRGFQFGTHYKLNGSLD